MSNQLIPGAPYNQNAVQIVKVDSAYTFEPSVRSAQVFAAGVTITLSTTAKPAHTGDVHFVAASGGNVSVLGGQYPILGNGSIVTNGSEARYELCVVPVTVMTPAGFAWVPMAAGGGFGTGEILVSKIIDIYNIPDVGLQKGVYARPVDSVDQPFEYDPDSLAVADGITIVNVLSTGAGKAGPTALPGRWMRNEIFSKRWATAWLPVNLPGGVQFDSEFGDNENDGFTPVTAIKDLAEGCRRLHFMEAGKNYQFKALKDILQSDRWRPSPLIGADAEDLVTNTQNGTLIEQVFNMTLTGTRNDIANTASTMTDNGQGVGCSITQAILNLNTQSYMADTNLPGNLSSHIGEMIVITSVPAGGDPLDIGAIAWIGKDLGANRARVSEFIRTNNAVIPADLKIGTGYKIVSHTKFVPSLIQTSSYGRFLVQEFEFPSPGGVGTDQNLVTARFASITFRACKVGRNWDASNGFSNGLVACNFDYHLLATRGIVSSSAASSVLAPTGCLFLNAEFRVLQQGVAILNSCYIQDGFLECVNNSAFLTFGFFNTAVGSGGVANVNIFGRGLSIYDWPQTTPTKSGFLAADTACVKVAGGGINGGFTVATPAGAIGLFVRGNSTIMISLVGFVTTVVQGQIVGDSGGTGDDLRISNPIVVAAPGIHLAMRAIQAGALPIAAAGAVDLDAQVLQSWFNWAGGGPTQFAGYAFNVIDGSRVILEAQS